MKRRTETAITFIIVVLSIGVAAAAIKTAIEYREPPTTTTQAEITTAMQTTGKTATEETTESETTTEATVYTTEEETSQIESISSSVAFFYDDGEPVYITHDEYYQICGVVMNETGYGSYEGCIAVAQCIRTQIIREKHKGNPYDIASIRALYGEHYTRTPNDLVRRAVTDVFYNHIVVTTEPIIAWCNGGSSWHNQQIKVCSYDGNDFYKLTKKDW